MPGTKLKKGERKAKNSAVKEEEWLLAEENFLERAKDKIDEILDLKSELDALGNESNDREKVRLLESLMKKDLKIVRRLERKVGRRERRRIRYEKRVLGNIEILQKDLGGLKEEKLNGLIEQIHVYSGRILSEVSMYTGKINELMKEKTPNIAMIARHTDKVIQSAKALIVLLESFQQLVNNCDEYKNSEDHIGVVKVHSPKLRFKILAGEAPLFYYHGTKPHLVESIFNSGILAPEMRLKIRDKDKFLEKLQKEINLFMRVRRTPRMKRLRKDFLNISEKLFDEKFEPITKFRESIDGCRLQREMFTDRPSYNPKVFYPYFDDNLPQLFFKKYEKFYVKRLEPEQMEHLSRKINKLVEKRINIIKQLAEKESLNAEMVDRYIELMRKAYSVFPHFQYLMGHDNLVMEEVDRPGSSSTIRWVVRKDKWFVYFAAELPFKCFADYHSALCYSEIEGGNEKGCVFEFKPTLFDKISWQYMGKKRSSNTGNIIASDYTGEIQYDVVSIEIISLQKYCSRIYCHKDDIVRYRKLLKKHGLNIPLFDAKEQKNVFKAAWKELS